MSIATTATLRFGFTMAEVDRLAKAAARRVMSATDFEDRYDAAWHGIVTALYEAETAPAERDLYFAGYSAAQRAATQSAQAHGRSARHDYGFGSAPAFVKFWAQFSTTPSHEDGVAERVALGQALGALTPGQYEALAAVAVCDTLREAAEALAIPYNTLIARYYQARDKVRRLWLEGETPRGTQVEGACKSGHDATTHGKTGPTGHRYCGECQRLARKRRRAKGCAA